MTRSYLLLLLAVLTILPGCAQLIAETSDPQVILPEKTPERPGDAEPAPQAVDTTQVPPVLLSTIHSQWCSRLAGDQFPELTLPQIRQAGQVELSSLYGKQATLVVMWTEDRWMSQMALEDVQRLVAGQHNPADVAVVGIAIDTPKGDAQRIVAATGSLFPHLLDTEGTALAEVGSVALPRLYVLDPAGKILWFDIEYSESTRRELLRTVAIVTGVAE